LLWYKNSLFFGYSSGKAFSSAASNILILFQKNIKSIPKKDKNNSIDFKNVIYLK
jgi:hypothetical protein